MFIKRDAYTEMLSWRNVGLKDTVLQVSGARQVGKTYLIREFCKQEFLNYVEINLLTGETILRFGSKIKSLIDSNLLNTTNLVIEEYLFTKYPELQDSEDNCIFIDEIQESPSIYNAIRHIARNHKIRCIVSGSYLGMITKNKEFFIPVEDLTIITLTTLKFSEFEEATESKFKSRLDCFNTYLNLGGYPRLTCNFLMDYPNLENIVIELLNTIISECKRYLDDVKFQASIKELYRSVISLLSREKIGLNSEAFMTDLVAHLKSNNQFGFKTDDLYIYIRWLFEAGIAGYADLAVDASFDDVISCKRVYLKDTLFLNSIYQGSSRQDSYLGILYKTYAYKVLSDAMTKTVFNPTFITYSKNGGKLDFCSYGLRYSQKKYGFEIKTGKSDYKTGKALLKDKKIDELIVFRADLDIEPTKQDTENHITVLPLFMMEEVINNINQAAGLVGFNNKTNLSPISNTQQETYNMTDLDAELLELSLPQYLKNDIKALKEGLKTNSKVLDCLWCELYGSINSAYWDGVISFDDAAFLRKKYLDLE